MAKSGMTSPDVDVNDPESRRCGYNNAQTQVQPLANCGGVRDGRFGSKVGQIGPK